MTPSARFWGDALMTTSLVMALVRVICHVSLDDRGGRDPMDSVCQLPQHCHPRRTYRRVSQSEKRLDHGSFPCVLSSAVTRGVGRISRSCAGRAISPLPGVPSPVRLTSRWLNRPCRHGLHTSPPHSREEHGRRPPRACGSSGCGMVRRRKVHDLHQALTSCGAMPALYHCAPHARCAAVSAMPYARTLP